MPPNSQNFAEIYLLSLSDSENITKGFGVGYFFDSYYILILRDRSRQLET